MTQGSENGGKQRGTKKVWAVEPEDRRRKIASYNDVMCAAATNNWAYHMSLAFVDAADSQERWTEGSEWKPKSEVRKLLQHRHLHFTRVMLVFDY